MNWLQIRLFGPYFSSFSTNSYGYYSQMSQNLITNDQIFASALIVRQAASSLSDLQWTGCKFVFLAHISAPFRPIATAITLKWAKICSQTAKFSLLPL